MFFRQFIVKGMGCLSYLIGCPLARKACVVDPKRDVQDYVDVARDNGMEITHIFETHIHADHVSGNQELSSLTGAETYFMEGTPAKFPHKEVHEGETMEFGNVRLEFMKTPGHTPHSMSILVTDLTRAEEPWLVLTGDCLFVGDIGRPDLAGKELLDEQIKNLYHSLHEKLGKLPPNMEIYPAHGQGSLCGKGMSSKPNSTIGFEMAHVPVLKLSLEEFKKEMTRDFPERPKSFSHIIDTNMSGAPLLERCPHIKDLGPQQVKELMEQGGVVLDIRDTAAFGGAHIPGSINIGLGPQTANWIGMVIEPDAKLILVVPGREAAQEMIHHLHRIGYDNIIGYLHGGMAAWQEAGMPIENLWQISAQRLYEKLKTGNYGHLFDIRTMAEWESGHIKEAEHLPLNSILKELPKVPKDEEIIVTCGVGYRGNIAASYLQRHGFTHVHSLAGGMKAWINSGYPVVR